MNRGVVARLATCLSVLSFCLYSHVARQSRLTSLRIELPKLARDVRVLGEENARLQYEIDTFSNPAHLIELSRSAKYSHLKHPMFSEVLQLDEGIAVQKTTQPKLPVWEETETLTLVGATH